MLRLVKFKPFYEQGRPSQAGDVQSGRPQVEGGGEGRGGRSEAGGRWLQSGRPQMEGGREGSHSKWRGSKNVTFFMIDAISNDRFGELIQFSI